MKPIIVNLTEEQVLNLTNPRLYVKVCHPDSKMMEGEILYFVPKKYYTTEKMDWYNEKHKIYLSHAILYKDVFEEIEWWEERKELPLYLKYEDGDIAKVNEYHVDNLPAYADFEHHTYNQEALAYMLPASEREYLDSQKTTALIKL
jgi:hypothetical protein